MLYYTANCIKVVCRESQKVKAKRERYDGFYELNIHLAYLSYGKKRDQKGRLAVARKSDFHWLYLTMAFVFITMNCFVL
jgi:hypothetical protein